LEITRIAKVGKEDKFAVFIDGVLKLFLSGESILGQEIRVGQKISDEQVADLSKRANEDLLFLRSLRYLSLRMRSEGELKTYLKKKGADQEQIRSIISRLKSMDLINDERFTAAFIHDKLLASPASKRKIAYTLRNKQIAEDIIEKSLSHDQFSDEESLQKLIAIKRRQSKYQDDLKLMQYLVRNGFNYSDVKRAVKNTASDY